jgi:hypothetical protein
MDPERSERIGGPENVRQESDTASSRLRGAWALLGAWADVDERDIDEWIDEIYAARKRDTGRVVRDFDEG